MIEEANSRRPLQPVESTPAARAQGTTQGQEWPWGALGLAQRAASRIAVLGLARSGIAAARLLLERGRNVDLLDLRLPEEASPRAEVAALAERGARLRIGPHDPAWANEYGLIVKSPGVPGSIPFLVEARRSSIAIIGELELAFLGSRGPIIAITGTNGKSTTTAWTGDMLRQAGMRSQVGGNIGRPFADAVLADPDAAFVLEVSSFQLEDSRTFRPNVAVLLNLTPDHVDRHGSLDAYLEAKMKIFDRQGPDDLALIGPDDALAARVLPRIRARLGRFGPDASFRPDAGLSDAAFLRDGLLVLRSGAREEALIPAAELSLPGPHNLENALAAAAAAAAVGASPEAVRRSLRTFGGLPHRLEPVGSIGDVRFVNDSKATNTDSLAVALRSFPQPVVLIAGGRDKGQDFSPLSGLVERKVCFLVLIGEAAEKLEKDWKVPSRRAADLDEAVRIAEEKARPSGVVLLSPACASFDMFRNYEERGDRFRASVQHLARAEAASSGPAS